VSETLAPSDRFSAAHAQFTDVVTRFTQGDLSAVGDFPAAAQQLLTIGRDIYASGPQFATLFRDVNLILQDVLEFQRAQQEDLLRDVPTTIIESSQNQIAELRAGFQAMVDELTALRAELRRLAA
jgi:uncharacterized coiled-coil protein SlyX